MPTPSDPSPELFGTADDGTRLHWYAWTTGTSPRPAVLVVHVGGFKSGNPGPKKVCTDLASVGYISFAIEYRLAPPGSLQGQVSDGRNPQQTADVRMAVAAARGDKRCNGQVKVVGGSA